MTTDESIEILEHGIIMFGVRSGKTEIYEAYKMAIEALSSVEQSMRNEFRLEVENSELRHQIEILKKKIDDGK